MNVKASLVMCETGGVFAFNLVFLKNPSIAEPV